MKVALVDDNAINRNNFIQKMEQYADVQITIIANSGDDFL